MLVRYTGPPDQYNADVALALRASAGDDTESTLESVHGDTVTVTDAPPVSGQLEHGRDYDLPGDLARGLVESSPWWEVSVQDFSTLSKTRLAALAKERGIEGYTTMDKDGLVEALRASSGPDAAPTSVETSGTAAPAAPSTAATTAGAATAGGNR